MQRSLPAGDVDDEVRGIGYARHRRPDPRIAARICAALGDARTVLNVRAGAGFYQPADRGVVPVEPSAAIRRQRTPGRVPAVDAVAQKLTFDDDGFDAAIALLTVRRTPRRSRRCGRPEALLDPAVRRSPSGWAFLGSSDPSAPTITRTRIGDLPMPDRRVFGVRGIDNVPSPVRALSSLPDAHYADQFTLPTSITASPEEWARAMFGDVPDRAASSACGSSGDGRRTPWPGG